MVKMQNAAGQKVNWTFNTDYCEIVGENHEGRIWDYVAILHGLKRFMKAEHMMAIFGSFEVVGRKVYYSCHVGSDRDIKAWNIVQESGDGEMWDDIQYLIDGYARPIQ